MLEHEFVQLLTNTPSLEVKVILKGKLNTALLRTPKLGLSFSATTDLQYFKLVQQRGLYMRAP